MRKFLRFVLASALCLLLLAVVAVAGFRANAWLQETETAQALDPEEGEFIETDLGRVHVTIWGDDNSVPLLMTHGMAAWGGLWEETGQFLAAQGYRVIAMDMPPFGFSDRQDQDFSRSRQAARIAGLVEAMELQDYFLLGHSYGGGVAMEAALRFPDGLSGIVLVCPVMRLAEGEAAIAAGDVPLPLRSQVAGEFLVSASITNPLLTGFLTRQFMHRREALTERHVAILQRPIRLEGNTANMVVWLRQFLQGDGEAWSRRPEKLAASSVSVGLIWGEQDSVTPIAQGEALADIVEPVSFVRMAETGHMPQLERPQQFNETLLKTLGALRAEAVQNKLSGELRTSISR